MRTCFFPQFWSVHETPADNLLQSFVHWESAELNLCAWFPTRCGDKLRFYLIRSTVEFCAVQFQRLIGLCKPCGSGWGIVWVKGNKAEWTFGFIYNWMVNSGTQSVGWKSTCSSFAQNALNLTLRHRTWPKQYPGETEIKRRDAGKILLIARRKRIPDLEYCRRWCGMLVYLISVKYQLSIFNLVGSMGQSGPEYCSSLQTAVYLLTWW